MKLFLASDVRSIYETFSNRLWNVKWKQVAWIQNGCDVYENPYRIQETIDFFHSKWVKLVPIDLREVKGDILYKKLLGLDGVYVTWWNIFYLLDIVRRSWFDQVLEKLRKEALRYAGSSAWVALLWKSIAHCNILDDESMWPNLESTDALGRLEYCFLPHRWKQKYKDKFEKIFELKNLPAPLFVMEDHHYITIDTTISS